MIVKLVSFLELPYELCLNVRLWRNSPQVAEFSKNKVITEEEHRKWLENMKLDKPKHLALMIFISQYGNRLNEQLLNNIVEIHQKFIINSKINSKINSNIDKSTETKVESKINCKNVEADEKNNDNDSGMNERWLPVGVVSFDAINYTKGTAEWGIYIYDTELRGKGIGTSALAESLKYARNNLGLSSLYLDVFKTNDRAIALYRKFGFTEIHCESDLFYKFKKEL